MLIQSDEVKSEKAEDTDGDRGTFSPASVANIDGIVLQSLAVFTSLSVTPSSETH